MDFAWSEEQAQLREAVKSFALEELNGGLREREKHGEFNRIGWKKCAEFGIHGLPVPTEYGGMGADPLTTVGVLENLGYGCRDNGLVFSINAHMWTLEMPLLDFGSEEQKRRYLPRLCDGSLIGGNAMTEPGSGSDAYSLRTTAERRGSRYILDGSKTFVSNGSVGDLFIVYATLDRSKGPNGICGFLVEKGYPGFEIGRPLEKMGLRTSPMAELFFDNCEVPVENLLGREGSGMSLFTHSMNWERSCILASAVGAIQRLFETSVRYARDRKQFGQSIGKFQLVATKIVDMRMCLDQARAALYQTAWLHGKGKSIFLEAALAKLTISENWVKCAEDAIQIHGGYGYMVETEIERELRDALGSRLYSGTSEVQRVIVATLLGL
ncbi:acyl-CoA dehydrogenase family protein [Microvirga massiliensis]|uniref:acyl-CoA dehydrogenase family protein n=1 Tax=Microvirga massiliensis TaxID=1033741 RepID=UPI00062B4923|nr:acyl-CoA dehydrogenase family protein [Microvirga massiliensis]